MIAIGLLALAAAADGRAPVGVFERWGAFRAAGPRRCYAISRPIRRGDGFASIGSFPGLGVRGQLHVRLSRPRDPAARVTLSIGERRFTLRAGSRDAWAGDAAADRAIVAAMRGARSMSIESVGARFGPFADSYALAGAASAIDAAALACL